MGVHICNKKQEAANVVPESPIEDAPAHEELLATSPPQASSPETRHWIEAQDSVGDSESLRPLSLGGLIVW